MKRSEWYFQQIIKGNKKGVIPDLIKFLLYPFSLIFKCIVHFRNTLFNKGWIRCYDPPVPLVISIGNIVAGGTGKTPFVKLLMKEFYPHFPLAVLSRGYRSPAENKHHPVFLSKGQGPAFPASYCGDEPFLLAQNFPKAYIIVGKDRRQSSKMASHEGIQILLLDDGMQHRQVSRDFEIVVVDGEDPFGQGYFLPRGFLRDTKCSLSRAHLIVINHFKDLEQLETVKHQIAEYSSAPIIAAQMHSTAILDLQGAPVSITGKKIGIFCGIAKPEKFRELLKGLEAEIVYEYFLNDHAHYNRELLKNISRNAKQRNAEILLCTEKDKVKIEENYEGILPIAWVQTELKIVFGEQHWQNFIQKAKAKLNV